jgi:hypothetical protein
VAVDRTSGNVVDLGKNDSFSRPDPFGPHAYLNLDAASLGVPLCQPVKRRAVDIDQDSTGFSPVLKDGPWTLQTFEDQSGSSAFLQRCGQRHVEAFGYLAHARLGSHSLAYLRGNRVVVRNLNTGALRPYAIPGANADLDDQIAMAGSQLVLSAFTPGPEANGQAPQFTIFASTR